MTTDEVRRTLEARARDEGYHVAEWLKPGLNGQGLRVACTRMIGKEQHGLGLKWSGEKIADLKGMCAALDYAMCVLPERVAKGKKALWGEQPSVQ